MCTHETKWGVESFDEQGLVAAIAWMAEQIPGGFFIYRADDSQEVLYVNEELLRIFGCETLEQYKELTGYTFRGLVHPDDFESVQNSIDDQIADEANKNLDYVEYRIIRRDGSVRWVDDYGHFAQLPGFGDVYYVFISDITEKHLMQEETRRRSNIYAGMLEQYREVAGNALAVYRANATAGVIEEASGHDLFAADVAGASVDAAWRERLASFLNDADRATFEQAFSVESLVERYYAGTGPQTMVAYCRRASGRRCFVHFTGSAVVDPVSGDVFTLGVETEYNFERVTEILNEKVLASQFDMVCYLVSDHIGVVIGGDGPKVLPISGDHSYASFVANAVLPVSDVDDDGCASLEGELALSTVSRALAHEEAYCVDITVNVGGAIRNKRFTYYAVDRSQDFYILLVSDMTDLLREQRLRNELLSNALRDAERANAAKTSFLSNMSHEIRTPMNAIIGYDTIALRNPDLDDETREYLRRIGESAKHLLSLINDILDMSRIESGRMTLRHEEFSFSEMLEQVNTMIESQCQDKGLVFECRVHGHVDDCYLGDDMKLKQVIINILSNAVKFTESGGQILFSVEKIGSFEGNATLRFTVNDTGIGMDEAFVPHIFEAFSQESSGIQTRFASTGLGMAITKNIVDMMNGTIQVNSKKGVGSEFVVTLTLSECDRASSFTRSSGLPHDLRVLIVDDERYACDHAGLVFDEIGVTAETCQTADEALRMVEVRRAKGEPYDLILMDWSMPGVDGLEVTRRIRRRFANEPTIVILTAYNWDEIMEEALESGVDGFMSKPLFASSVMTELDRIVARRGIRRAERTSDLAGKRVLLAEDVDINAEIMLQVLGMRDMVVERAHDGQEALDLFRASKEGHFDVVLMDVRMPVMDGLTATTRIRALERDDARTIPIIALTANAFDEDVQNSLQAGMTAHLSKPVEIDALYGMIERLIWE